MWCFCVLRECVRANYADPSTVCSTVFQSLSPGSPQAHQMLNAARKDAFFKILLTDKVAMKVYVLSDGKAVDGLSLKIRPFQNECKAREDERKKTWPQLELWTAGGNDKINGGFLSVGVNDKELVLQGYWIAHVHFDPPDAAATIEYTIGVNMGSSACRAPASRDLYVCGEYVTYSTLDVQWRHLERPLKLGRGFSFECLKALVKASCFQSFPMCDPNTGLARKPCPSVCKDVQVHCPSCSSEERGTDACPPNWRQENYELNQKYCFIPQMHQLPWRPPSLTQQPVSLFGPTKTCFADPSSQNDAFQRKACRQIHFACETPECYPTARPLFCEDAL